MKTTISLSNLIFAAQIIVTQEIEKWLMEGESLEIVDFDFLVLHTKNCPSNLVTKAFEKISK